MKTVPLLAAVALLTGCAPEFHAGPVPGAPSDATYAQIDGVRVRFVERGEGPPVVLIHGFASSLETWAAVMPELAKHHRVLALDLKGFGWSSRPEGDYSPQAEARLVIGLMDQRNVKSAAIVAHSWGSSVALALALAARERVTRIALYDAWVYEEQIPTFFIWSRAPGVGEALFGMFYKERADERIALAFYDKERFVTERLVDEVDAALERPGTVAAALAATRGQRFAEVQTRYRSIDLPTFLLWGRDDIVTPLDVGERLVRDLPHARLRSYPRCGHFPMIEAVHESTSDLIAFLDETAAAPPAVSSTPAAPATPATRESDKP